VQDRYFGDIGDFAKYGLLRAVTEGEPPLRLAVLWYLVPDESHNGDGRHIDYLEPTPANLAGFRDCDPELYDKLRDLVRAGRRSVSAVPDSALLPPGTIHHTAPLDYSTVADEDRHHLRTDWLADAHDAAAAADLVFLDPDNGLEAGTGRYAAKGPKFVFYDDLPALSPGKTLVVYQHATRTGTFEEQLEARMEDLGDRLCLPQENLLAMRWRRVSPRAFLFALADPHRELVVERHRAMLAGPWGAHFELVPAGLLARA
jgi:hypothetical protein